MLTWLAAHLGTILVAALILAMVAAILCQMVKDKKSGKSSCGGNCAGCSGNCGSCHSKASGH